MNIEHSAFNVADSRGMARWLVENLGMRVLRSGGAPEYGFFICDAAGRCVIEIYSNPLVPVPDYASQDARVTHLAFEVSDVSAVRDALVRAGARPDGDVATTPGGDTIAMVRDPWGFAIQLVRRAKPMLPPQ
jgi:catechol 2,3-dioxygenase-like lactoylglutathione lyase family enzyme